MCHFFSREPWEQLQRVSFISNKLPFVLSLLNTTTTYKNSYHDIVIMATTNSTEPHQVSETTTIGLLTTSNTSDQQPPSDATRGQPNANNGVSLEPIPASLAVEYSEVSECCLLPASPCKKPTRLAMASFRRTLSNMLQR